MPFSFAKRLSQGQTKTRLYLHIVVRVIVLWILGMAVQGRLLRYDLSQLRLYSNTLQAIASGYLIASILLLSLRVRWQVAVTVALLLLYWALLMLVPVPGFGAGQLTEEGNLAIYLDKLILGPYQDGTAYTWILSSMTFATTVMLGAFAGQLLRSELGTPRKRLFLLGAGVACTSTSAPGGAGSSRSSSTSGPVRWGALPPAAGAWCCWDVFYLIIDVCRLRFLAFSVRRHRHERHLRVRGQFPLPLAATGAAQRGGGVPRGSGIPAGALWYDTVLAVATFLVLWLILLFMYRKKIFVKV